MADRDPIDAAALALLVVPLAGAEPDTNAGWHLWEDSFGQPGGVDANTYYHHEVEPYKRYPPAEGAYFTRHVECLLFPRSSEPCNRWLHCPEDLWLRASLLRGMAQHHARVELLEILTLPGREDCAVGLIHLALRPDGEEGMEVDPLWWAWAIRSKFRRSTVERPHLELCRDGDCTELRGKRPLRQMVESTLGSPRKDLEQRLYTVLMTPCPPNCEADKERQAGWRHEVAKRAWEFPDEELEEEGRESVSPETVDREQTVDLGRFTALVQGDAAILTCTGPLTKGSARDFRSYWSESLVAGLIQHDCLEHFQDRLAGLGTPVKPDIEPLYRDWLDFRNRVWWSQLSTGTPVPQRLLAPLRAARGTERLFTDLEGDLATYSAQRRSVVDSTQAEALQNLQIGGAGIVVLGPLLAIVALTGASHATLAALVVAAVSLSLAAATLAHILLKPREI